MQENCLKSTRTRKQEKIKSKVYHMSYMEADIYIYDTHLYPQICILTKLLMLNYIWRQNFNLKLFLLVLFSFSFLMPVGSRVAWGDKWCTTYNGLPACSINNTWHYFTFWLQFMVYFSNKCDAFPYTLQMWTIISSFS